MADPNSKIIFPLDVSSLGESDDWCQKLHKQVGLMKVGLELFTQYGPEAVAHARHWGHEVMLDLKLHDIPATVAKAAANAAGLGAKFITVHATGGPEMLKAAVGAVHTVNPKATVLAVTILTSLENGDIINILGAGLTVHRVVGILAQMAWKEGVRGFVCSPLEVASLRRVLGPEAVLVVPGVRPLGADDNDQKRVATPAKAMEDGANYLVVGRPIRHAADPVAAALAIAEEIRPFVP